ncbi:MAG: mannosyl-3 phosphoglycerate phosphatase, partial [Chloroflexi bacterium CG07_land_8_20_14_0_80_51_10]
MRIERSTGVEHLGTVRIHGVRRVLELDSGARTLTALKESVEAQKIERDSIDVILPKLAIVLPTKNEDLKVFEGVLSGVPHDCMMIVVSNSQRGEIDRFISEQEILSHFCNATKRNALIIHQKDPYLGKALAEAGYTEILDEDGLVRSGKSEGMVIGILLALLQGKEYVGFIDTDNYIPGAVWEYAQHYAIGFSLTDSPYAMVRILWHYKPKISGELYFKRWGRVSEITNKYLNHLLSTKGKFETEIIKTANAGEHAISLSLAMKLTYATGYGVETQEVMSIFEQFGMLPITEKTATEKGIDIIQTETINPHLHEEKGEEHLLQDLLMPSLSVIYHNPSCEEETKQLIAKQLVELECIKPDEAVPAQRMIPPPETANVERFTSILEKHLVDYAVPKGWSLWTRLPLLARKAETKKVVFTDLDGTLLHPVSYSYAAALDSLRELQKAGIPIVFCSAKTRLEQQVYREELGIKAPFIVENGAAIVIPKDYFHLPFSFSRTLDDYYIIELGIPYQQVRDKLKSLPDKCQAKITCFGDLSIEDLAKLTGLNLRMAALAHQREYSETLAIQGDKKQIRSALNSLKEIGLSYTFGGKFWEAYQGGDKSKTTKILIELFRLNFGDIAAIGIGDSENDEPMLAAVDMPILVQRADNRWKKLKVQNLQLVKGVGPEGWS